MYLLKNYINESPFEGGAASKHAALYVMYCLWFSFKFLCYVYGYVMIMCVCVRISGFSITQSLHIRKNCNLFLVRATVKNLVLALAMDLYPILAASIHTCVCGRK